MRVRGRVLVLFYVCSAVALARIGDSPVANLLGPQWRQVTRKAGMIFAGEVQSAPGSAVPTESGAFRAVAYTIRVDEPIAGVERGQVVTVREWAPAYSARAPLMKGQHVLLLLYPPSRLGLTSPVGGWLGQIMLDSAGSAVAHQELARRQVLLATPAQSRISGPLNVPQLARELHSAREE